jgi:hypothetical protein
MTDENKIDIPGPGNASFDYIPLAIRTMDTVLPDYSMAFSDSQGKEVGRISWGTGKMIFEGDADISATRLFEYLKQHIDIYIETEHKALIRKDYENNLEARRNI